MSAPSSSTFTPDLYVQYFRDLGGLTAGGRAPSPELIAGVLARYGTQPAIPEGRTTLRSA